MDFSQIGNSLGAATVAVFLLEWLKKQPWFTWLSEESTKRVKTIFAAVFAVASVVGIGYVWNPDAGTLTITGLTLAGLVTGLVTFLWTFAKQYAFQKIAYKVVKATGKVSKPVAAVSVTPFERP